MKLFFKKLLVFKLCLCLAISGESWAQALPVAQPDRVGRAVSGALQGGMISRGFAANDPRFGNTLARISPQLAGVVGSAATVTIGAVTAPGWASVALAIGIGAVITYAVNLALDSLSKWLFRTDAKLDESGAPLTVSTSTTMTSGGAYWKASFHSGNISIDLSGGDGEAVARQGYSDYQTQSGQSNQTAPNCSVSTIQVSCGVIYAYSQPTGAPASCPAGTLFKNGACGAYSFIAPASVPTKTGLTPQQATTDIPSSDLDKKLNPAIVAALANKAWQQAAVQPGYDGLPYPQSNPITASEVTGWTAQNPDLSPTVRDFTAPNPTTSAQTQPWALPQNPSSAVTTPATVPNQNTTNPSTQPVTNLGPDPGTGAPTLERTPTAQEILSPIFNLLPSLRNFSPSTQSGTCPRPSFSLLGQTHVMEAHCILIENNKAVMQAAMAFAWAVFALFIILSA